MNRKFGPGAFAGAGAGPVRHGVHRRAGSAAAIDTAPVFNGTKKRPECFSGRERGISSAVVRGQFGQ